jgi:hypothetical protein
LEVTEGGANGIFEYYYDICLTNDCGRQLTSHGIIENFPARIDFCGNKGTVIVPSIYTNYTLTKICDNCCDCCEGNEVPTYSPSVTPTITPTQTPTPTPSSTSINTMFIYIPNL